MKPSEVNDLIKALNEHLFDEVFIEPLFEMFYAQGNPAYTMQSILETARKILPRHTFPPELDDQAVGMIQLFFALRYFAFRRFNGTTEHRVLTNSCVEAGKDDGYAMIILTTPLIEGSEEEHFVKFDHRELADRFRTLLSKKGAEK